MLRSEGSYSTGGRHSSTDSNKASSGDVSPYDNNSPVLSERSLVSMQEEAAHSPDKLYKVPEQYTLVGHLQPKTKENSSASQAGKGSVHLSCVPPSEWQMGVSEIVGKCPSCIIKYQDLSSSGINYLTKNWPTKVLLLCWALRVCAQSSSWAQPAVWRALGIVFFKTWSY